MRSSLHWSEETTVKKKLTPEQREEIRRINEEGRKARETLQAALDRAEAWLAAERERREIRMRRRARLRRLFPFRRAA